MKIIKMIGGFGNQMFQYALGKSIEAYTGDTVLFDISTFKEDQKKIIGNTGRDANGVCIRSYEIDIFPNICINIASQQQIKLCKGLKIPKILRKNVKL